MILPALIPVGVSILIGILPFLRNNGGDKLMGGALVGTIVTGVFLALAMTSGGGAWVTAGPAINPMIKVFNIVALLLIGFLVH